MLESDNMARYSNLAHKKKAPAHVKVGKHGVAVKRSYPAWQIALAALIAVMLALIPITIACSHIRLDSRAFADSTRSAFAGVDDTAPQAVGLSMPTDTANYTAYVGTKMQNSLMSGGCELVSLGIVLESMGLDVDLDRIASDFLDVDGHFATGYSGDPYSQGAGYPPGIAAAANGYLESIGSTVHAHDLTGMSFDELKALVKQGYPVLVWSTMEFEDPQFTGMFDGEAEWYDNEHCVVFYGVSDGQALVSDPLDGLVTRDADRFASIYEQCGKMAVVLF